MTFGRKPMPLRDRFDRHVVRGADQNACWRWTGATNNKGYGVMNRATGSTLAHRIAFELANAPIPAGQVVRHRCDTPICVNPAHLELGTMKDNTADMVARGRARHGCVSGSKNSAAKLVERDVGLIKLLLDCGVKNISVAKLFGVSDTKIAHIKHGKSWRHVPALEAPSCL